MPASTRKDQLKAVEGYLSRYVETGGRHKLKKAAKLLTSLKLTNPDKLKKTQ